MLLSNFEEIIKQRKITGEPSEANRLQTELNQLNRKVKDVKELGQKVSKLRKTTREQENEIERLKAGQLNQGIDELNRKLKTEEDRYKKLCE